MSNVNVELPVLQSLVNVGGTYDAPARNITFGGITFTGTSWLGPSSNQGFADQQTGAYMAGNQNWPPDRINSCQSGCAQFEAVRPHWFQMPAAVQVSAASGITFTDSQFVNLGQTAIGIGNDANAHASGVGLGASGITVTRSEIARNSAGGVVVGGVRADAHHPSDQRMVNRDITVSYNRIHDLGVEYRGNVSVLNTYVTTATVSHNEVYNMPYSGLSLGYGWGANDAGGSNHYANRGLYNYQPRYSTPTTASNNKLINNYVHDVMQQMTDGGCIYTLALEPERGDQRQPLPAHQRLVRALLRRGLQVLPRDRQRLLRHRNVGHRQLLGRREHGQLDPHQQLVDQQQHQRHQRRPRQRRQRQRRRLGRQLAVRRPGGDGQRRAGRQRWRRPGERHGRRQPVEPLRRRRHHEQQHPGEALGLQRRREPALELHVRASSSPCRASVSTSPAQEPPTAPRRSSGTVTAA